MRFLLALVFCCVSGVFCFGQATGGDAPGLPKDPRGLLAAAAPFYDFNDAALKPWHLKASYQFYDAKGNPAEQGTFEYWWASPKVRRSSWTRPGAARTDWSTADGKLFRQEIGAHLRYFERTLMEVLSSPLPDHALIDSGRMELGLKSAPAGKVKMPCVTGSLRMFVGGKLESHASSPPDDFCLDPASLAVRMTSSRDSITTGYNQIVRTQGRYLARQVDVSVGKQKVFSITVQTIDSLNPADPALTPGTDAVIAQNAISQSSSCFAGDDVKSGSLETKVQPHYPSMAKSNREQGDVILGVLIGPEGNVHDLEVLSTPSPALADAAVEAVKQWHYRSCMSNGAAVEMDAIVYVFFMLRG